MKQRSRFLLIISLLLFVGFTTSSIVSHVVTHRTVNHYLPTDTPPIATNNTYADKQGGQFPPLLVSALEDSQTALWLSLLVGLIASAAILYFAYYTLGHYEQRLEENATIDKLTTTATRHAFEPTFINILQLAKRNQQSLSIVLIDVDHLKTINIAHGRLQGDRVLQALAETLKSESRGSDSICRWSGDTFLMLLPECPQPAAIKMAEKIRQLIQASLHTVGGKQLAVTASIGVAEFNGDDSMETFFGRADEALHRAKEGGRNRVCTSIRS